MSKNIAIIFAGGVGKRMGAGNKPKQFLEVHGMPIIIHTLKHFEKHRLIDEIIVVSVEEYIADVKRLIDDYHISKVTSVIAGGVTSQDSIYNGLAHAGRSNAPDTIVLIHDGVRPIINEDLITRNIESVKENGNAITCSKSNVTTVISADGKAIGDVPIRDHAYSALAPQSFRLGEILRAHEEERKTNPAYTNVVDACTMMRRQGKPVFIVDGSSSNIKITTPEDYYLMVALLQYFESKDVLGI